MLQTLLQMQFSHPPGDLCVALQVGLLPHEHPSSLFSAFTLSVIPTSCLWHCSAPHRRLGRWAALLQQLGRCCLSPHFYHPLHTQQPLLISVPSSGAGETCLCHPWLLCHPAVPGWVLGTFQVLLWEMLLVAAGGSLRQGFVNAGRCGLEKSSFEARWLFRWLPRKFALQWMCGKMVFSK